MKQRIQGIHHIGVSVPDIAKAREFYIDLLGAVEEVPPFGWEPGNSFIDSVVGLKDSSARQFIVRLGNVHIEVFEYLSPRSPPHDPDKGVHHFGYTHLALQVDDIRSVYQRMTEAGIRFHTPPDYSTITVAEDGSKRGYCATYGRDFFGNVFEIMEIHPNDEIKPV
jgi:catechol 2,3-dioxygenase-like lactoylglutathione lyase family enzyme